MKTAIAINARVGSKRLPDKHFAEIEGKPALKHLIERIARNNVIIATCPGSERFEELGCAVFYGHPINIPKRHMQMAKEYDLDAIISVDGDDILTSPKAIADTFIALEMGYPLVRTEGLPYGMNVLWAYTIPTLEKALIDVPGECDTNWGKIFKDKPHIIEYTMPTKGRNIRLTLDYDYDLDFLRWIFKTIPKDILADDERFCEWL